MLSSGQSDIENLAAYFTKRLYGVSQFHALIRGINVGVACVELYGHKHVRVSFDATIEVKDIDALPYERQRLLNECFANNVSGSGSGFISFLIVHERSRRDEQFGYARQLQRLKEFYDYYTAFAAMIIPYCENFLGRNVPICVENLNNLGEFACIQRLWKDGVMDIDEYRYRFRSEFEQDAYQYAALLRSSHKHEAHFATHPENFLLTDQVIRQGFAAKLNSLRSLILEQDIPIHIDGIEW